jgi:hypothetical protein
MDVAWKKVGCKKEAFSLTRVSVVWHPIDGQPVDPCATFKLVKLVGDVIIF